MSSYSLAAHRLVRGRHAGVAAAILALTLLGWGARPAQATDGYFMTGAGVQSKGLAGAGTAWGNDPLAAMANPALGLQIGNAVGGNLEIFNPDRDATVGGVEFESSHEIFALPALGYNKMLGKRSSIGAVFTANGGMNTTYEQAPGPFGMSPTGVDLMQAFLGVNYAHTVGHRLTFGVMPVLAIQAFEAKGLQAFGGMSQSPADVTNRGRDWSFGGGVKVGALWDVSPKLSIGASYQSEMWQSAFSKYKGLFAEGGSFDIPAALRAGIAVHPEAGLTLLLDYEHIYYGSIAAIANSGSNMAPLGSANGPGFGWQDMDVYTVGVEWQASPKWALRAGYSLNSRFTDGSQAMFNILAPAVIQQHLALGASCRLSSAWQVDGAFTHAFHNTLNGSNPMLSMAPPNGFGYPNDSIALSMEENEFTLGFTWRH